MNVLYISSVCAQSRFDKLANSGLIDSQFQNQKFHHLLLEGLREIKDVSISVVSFYPINRTKTCKMNFEMEDENGIHYIYPSYLNSPVIHHIAKFVKTFQFLYNNRQDNSIIVCNIMNFDECLAALIYRKFHPIRICAITADVPGISSGSGKNNGAWWKRIMTKAIYPIYKSMSSKYDGYMFLAQPMNNVVNLKNKPYIVVEGLADTSVQSLDTNIEKYSKKTIMYAGGLHREYGIEILVQAFKKIAEKDIELHIYGKGNYEKELIMAGQQDKRIKYFGVKPNSDIVAAQMKSHILVNPRPTTAEFVKYSFPSKIMECMASGTPLLTTRIPSMPSEYFPYVFLIEDETVNGFYETLKNVLSLSDEQLQEKGHNAKSYILKEKNYQIQSNRLYEMLLSLKNSDTN